MGYAVEPMPELADGQTKGKDTLMTDWLKPLETNTRTDLNIWTNWSTREKGGTCPQLWGKVRTDILPELAKSKRNPSVSPDLDSRENDRSGSGRIPEVGRDERIYRCKYL